MKTHGHTKNNSPTPTYGSWYAMKARCNNTKNSHYHLYGGRGITVYEPWLFFENFLSDMGERPLNHTLDRIDNSSGYSPSNCRWASLKEQAQNKRNNTIITANNKSQCLQEWANELNVPQSTLSYRLNHGWSHDDLINTPVAKTMREICLSRKTTRYITIDNETKCVSDWSRLSGINITTITNRLNFGWNPKDAVFKTPRKLKTPLENHPM